jgi:hypothetical protein
MVDRLKIVFEALLQPYEISVLLGQTSDIKWQTHTFSRTVRPVTMRAD